jgi:ABC-type Mn2+/Zn2+ transport system ATPase subunit
MMLVESVSIVGLWGSRNLDASFFEDSNFLIGPNGSGKTTVINLIAAVLTADWPTLSRIPFSRVRLVLNDQETGSKSTVAVDKSFDRQRRFPSLSYRFEDDKGPRDYSGDDIDRQMRHHPTRRMIGAIFEELRSVVRVQWLSIHRSPLQSADDDEDDSYESTVDQKLDELSRELIKFFSKLASAGEAESEQFQKTVFTSLLYGQTSQWDLITSVKSLNLDHEKTALEEIFRKFGVPERAYSDQLTEHFNLVSAALSSGIQLSTPHLIALVSMRSIHLVVKDWQSTLERQLEISKPKEQFLSLLNEMMKPRKRFSVNEKNELQSWVGDRPIGISELSSGEKQMLILLGEALLQERENWVYIADEPELSLHVKWQETLTDNLRQINPNAQIIFATHSPDIVGPHQDRVLNVEDLLR